MSTWLACEAFRKHSYCCRLLLLPPPTAAAYCCRLLLLQPPTAAAYCCRLLLLPPTAAAYCCRLLLLPPPTAAAYCCRLLLLPPPTAAAYCCRLEQMLEEGMLLFYCEYYLRENGKITWHVTRESVFGSIYEGRHSSHAPQPERMSDPAVGDMSRGGHEPWGT